LLLSAPAKYRKSCSLYFGLAGMAAALHAVHAQLEGTPAAAAAGRALNHVRSRFPGPIAQLTSLFAPGDYCR
jgi:hypothetical protein